MEFNTLTLREENTVLYVTINNPPINLMTGQMAMELFQLQGMLMIRQDLRVVVMESADPDFWINHFDVNDLETALHDPSKQSRYKDVNLIQGLAASWQALPQVTLAKVKGRARGAGLEFLLGLDMRFVTENSLFGFPEADAGFLASGGGTTRTVMMAGPARGMEILLSTRDFTGKEFERYGLVNRALPDGEIDSYVEALVDQLAKRTPEVLLMHRAVIDQAVSPFIEPMFRAMAAENDGFRSAVENGSIQRSIKALQAIGQTREMELDLPATLAHKAAAS